jgi:hypothetical protein
MASSILAQSATIAPVARVSAPRARTAAVAKPAAAKPVRGVQLADRAWPRLGLCAIHACAVRHSGRMGRFHTVDMHCPPRSGLAPPLTREGLTQVLAARASLAGRALPARASRVERTATRQTAFTVLSSGSATVGKGQGDLEMVRAHRHSLPLPGACACSWASNRSVHFRTDAR